MRRLSFVFALTALVPLSGCLTDLGECDWGAATELVFEDDGTCASQTNGQPMYAGQALVMGSCGNGQVCHTSGIASQARTGASAGLDLNVGIACRGHGCGYTTGPARFTNEQALMVDLELVAGSPCVGNTIGYDFAYAGVRAGDVLTVSNLPASDTTTTYTIVRVFTGGDSAADACPSPSLQIRPTPTHSSTGADWTLYKGDYPQKRELAALERLRSNQAIVMRHARDILQSVRGGRMPIVNDGVDTGPRYRRVDYLDPALSTVELRWRVRDPSFALPSGQCVATPADLAVVAPTEVDKVDWWPLVPAVGTTEGNEIVRNWLACGAPVVEAAALPFTQTPGQSCMQNDAAGHVGTCMAGVNPVIVPPEPTWCSIYENVIQPLCVNCHGGPGTPHYDEHHLDLSDVITAYNQLVNRGSCGLCNTAHFQDPTRASPRRDWNLVDLEQTGVDGTTGEPIYRPDGSARSLLVRKLDNLWEPGWSYTYANDPVTGLPVPVVDAVNGIPLNTGACGSPMPGADALLPEAVMAPIRAWIDAGAALTVADEDRSTGLRCRAVDTDPATTIDNDPLRGLEARCATAP